MNHREFLRKMREAIEDGGGLGLHHYEKGGWKLVLHCDDRGSNAIHLEKVNDLLDRICYGDYDKPEIMMKLSNMLIKYGERLRADLQAIK